MDRAFKQLAERYIGEVTTFSPVWSTWLGDHRHDGLLDEVSEQAIQRKVAFCRGCLTDLAAIPRAKLSRANQVDAAMLGHRLQAELWHAEELREWTWNPTIYTGLVGNAVYSLLARDFAPLPERLGNVAARLSQFPRLLAETREVLDPQRVPRIHAETAVRQNRGVLRILEDMVRPGLESLGAADRRRLVRAMGTARRAVEDHQKWLEQKLLPRAKGDFRLGRERYDRKLAFALQTPLTRQQVRKRATEEFHRVRREMYALAAEVYRREHPYTRLPARPSEAYRQAIVRAALEMACRQTVDVGRIVETAREFLANLTEFIRQSRAVTLPLDPVDVIVMPEFQRGTSLAYCDSPGPLDVGQKTFYAIAPPPADWSAEQVRSLLREYNTRSLCNLTVHEAMPGHFLQLAHANRYDSPLRAMLASGTFIEGWAVYAERMVIDEGFMDGDPLMRLVVLKWYLRGIVNAIIDQAIHVEGMTREDAMALMVEGAFQEDSEAAAKWVRAQLTSAQLPTYFVGYLEHAALRREVQAAWGRGFSLRRYHDTLLSFGSPPTRYVRAMILNRPIDTV
jgi:uncharacterized protein (DUF885 family)